eukprot:175547-Prorocentrum_lima.AAC.1
MAVAWNLQRRWMHNSGRQPGGARSGSERCDPLRCKHLPPNRTCPFPRPRSSTPAGYQSRSQCHKLLVCAAEG